MKDIFMNIWKWLDGNKTIICLGIVTIIQKLIEFQLLSNSNIVQFTSWIFLALGTGALVQHVQKGFFSTSVGGPVEVKPDGTKS